MFAGKTSEVLMQYWRETNLYKKSAICLKPHIDVRYDSYFNSPKISTHNLCAIDAKNVTVLDDALLDEAMKYDVIILDECQFFTNDIVTGNIYEFVEKLLTNGKTIIMAGLDMDYKGNPFPVSAHFLAKTDTVIKPKARCSICGKPATKTFKYNGDMNNTIDVGNGDKYEPRCNDCWRA
jgi:thymidine kinase